MKLLSCWLFISLNLIQTLEARTIYYGSTPETIRIVYGGQTIFRFEKPVRTVSQAARFTIKPVDDESPNYAMLSVEPRFLKSTSAVSFILTDGSIVNTRLTVVPSDTKEKVESVYDFKAQSSLIKQTSDSPQLGKIDLMKALIRGDFVAGYDIKELSMEIPTGLEKVEATLTRLYTGQEFNGYVFQITNQSEDSKVEIDVRKLKIGQPNLAIFSSVDRELLEVKGSSRNVALLKIIAKPAALSSEVILPVAWVKNGKEETNGR